MGRAKSLLGYFKTIQAIQEADVDTLLGVKGMTRPSAQRVYDYFHKNK